MSPRYLVLSELFVFDDAIKFLPRIILVGSVVAIFVKNPALDQHQQDAYSLLALIACNATMSAQPPMTTDQGSLSRDLLQACVLAPMRDLAHLTAELADVHTNASIARHVDIEPLLVRRLFGWEIDNDESPCVLNHHSLRPLRPGRCEGDNKKLTDLDQKKRGSRW